MPFHLVFGGVMGTISPDALEGYRLVRKTTDQFSRLSFVHFLKAQNDVLDGIHLFVKTFVILLLHQLHRFRADKGGEYTAEEIRSYFRHTRTRLELTAAATSKQNGVSERDGGILASLTPCFVGDSDLPKLSGGSSSRWWPTS